MSYELIAIPNFKREIKKLAKKFPSLKNDFAQLLESLQQLREPLLAITATKYAWPSLPKAKVNPVDHGWSHT